MNVVERWVPGVHNSMLTNMYTVNVVERWVPGVDNSMLTNMYTVNVVEGGFQVFTTVC